jgi:hypothetical protein
MSKATEAVNAAATGEDFEFEALAQAVNSNCKTSLLQRPRLFCLVV